MVSTISAPQGQNVSTEWQAQAADRERFDILFSCFSTLFLCTWMVLHLNLPAPESRTSPRDNSTFRQFMRQAKWFMLNLWAPEVTVYLAGKQFLEARSAHPRSGWSLTQKFFVGMGGLAILSPDCPESIRYMSPQAIDFVHNHDPRVLADVFENDLIDKRGSEVLSKSIACIQMLWFIFQSTARLQQDLPITQLELITLFHCLCAIVTYTFWWHKPWNVSQPIVLQNKPLARLVAWVYTSQEFKRKELSSDELRLISGEHITQSPHALQPKDHPPKYDYHMFGRPIDSLATEGFNKCWKLAKPLIESNGPADIVNQADFQTLFPEVPPPDFPANFQRASLLLKTRITSWLNNYMYWSIALLLCLLCAYTAIVLLGDNTTYGSWLRTTVSGANLYTATMNLRSVPSLIFVGSGRSFLPLVLFVTRQSPKVPSQQRECGPGKPGTGILNGCGDALWEIFRNIFYMLYFPVNMRARDVDAELDQQIRIRMLHLGTPPDLLGIHTASHGANVDASRLPPMVVNGGITLSDTSQLLPVSDSLAYLADETYGTSDGRRSTSAGSQTSSTEACKPSSRSSSPAKLGNPTRKRHQKWPKGHSRKVDDHEDNSGDSEDEDDENQNRKKKKTSCEPCKKRLRCPFYSNNPEKYELNQACSSGLGFPDMTRLMQHLKRVHLQPQRCPRCHLETVSQKLLNEHLRQKPLCMERPHPHDDRIHREDWEVITKRPPDYHLRSVEEKWTILYRALFPAQARIPSPYDGPVMMHQLEPLLVDELEEELSKWLDATTLSKVKNRVPEILQKCRSRMSGEDKTQEKDPTFQHQEVFGTTSQSSHGKWPSQDLRNSNEATGMNEPLLSLDNGEQSSNTAGSAYNSDSTDLSHDDRRSSTSTTAPDTIARGEVIGADAAENATGTKVKQTLSEQMDQPSVAEPSQTMMGRYTGPLADRTSPLGRIILPSAAGFHGAPPMPSGFIDPSCLSLPDDPQQAHNLDVRGSLEGHWRGDQSEYEDGPSFQAAWSDSAVPNVPWSSDPQTDSQFVFDGDLLPLQGGLQSMFPSSSIDKWFGQLPE